MSRILISSNTNLLQEMTWFHVLPYFFYRYLLQKYISDLTSIMEHAEVENNRKFLSFTISLLALHQLREDWLEKPYGRWQTKGRHCVHTVPWLRHPATSFKGLIRFGWVFLGMYVFHGSVCLPQVSLILKQFVGVNSSSEHSAAAVTVTPAGTGCSLRRG